MVRLLLKGKWSLILSQASVDESKGEGHNLTQMESVYGTQHKTLHRPTLYCLQPSEYVPARMYLEISRNISKWFSRVGG